MADTTLNYYISVSTAAKKWGVSKPAVYKWAKTGKIPGAYKVNYTWVIPDQDRPKSNKKRANTGNKTISIRSRAVDIIWMFETILDRHGIKIPDEAREGDESEAALFGYTYGEVEDYIIGELVDLVIEAQNNPHGRIDRLNF